MENKFTMKDLKTLDIIQLRNGSYGIVILEHDRIVYQFGGYDDLSFCYDEDLRDIYDGRKFDIVKVFRDTAGFLDLDKEEPIFISDDIDVVYDEEKK